MIMGMVIKVYGKIVLYNDIIATESNDGYQYYTKNHAMTDTKNHSNDGKQ